MTKRRSSSFGNCTRNQCPRASPIFDELRSKRLLLIGNDIPIGRRASSCLGRRERLYSGNDAREFVATAPS